MGLDEMGRNKGTKEKWQGRKKRSFTERFWEKVDKRGEDECWNWIAYIHPSGYGTININRKMYFAHRIVWILTRGPILAGQLICHHCDNRICCNPNHLFLGTHQDNANDRDVKGRGKVPDNRGENHGMARLTESEVIKIRNMYGSGQYTQTELGNIFGIDRRHIGNIVHKRSWAWLK